VQALPIGTINVLELFAGQGLIWKAVKSRTGRTIKTTRIDEKKISSTIRGDNRKIIPNLDLSMYNIIDCDAYGNPYEQIKLMFENKTLKSGTIVHFTFNRAGPGMPKRSILTNIGIGKHMVKKCPTLFSSLAYPAFLEYLRKNGVKRVWEVHNDTVGGKTGRRIGIYGYFIVAKDAR